MRLPDRIIEDGLGEGGPEGGELRRRRGIRPRRPGFGLDVEDVGARDANLHYQPGSRTPPSNRRRAFCRKYSGKSSTRSTFRIRIREFRLECSSRDAVEDAEAKRPTLAVARITEAEHRREQTQNDDEAAKRRQKLVSHLMPRPSHAPGRCAGRSSGSAAVPVPLSAGGSQPSIL